MVDEQADSINAESIHIVAQLPGEPAGSQLF
jgi:hypothetical protein